jgi:hypothetical protein
MGKKQHPDKKGKAELVLSPEESDEIQMIIDRLAVQDPEGESFERYLQSLRNALATRPLLASSLVDKLSRNPNRTGFLTFDALAKSIETSPYRRHLKQAAYRFSQKGFTVSTEGVQPEKVVLIQGETRKAVAHFFQVKGALWLIAALIPERGHAAYSLITAFLEDEFESFNVRIAESSPKLYREYLQKVAEHAEGGKALEIPLWHAAGLFFEMLDLWTGKGSYAELERGRDVFTHYRDPAKQPHVYGLMPEIERPEAHFSEFDIEALISGMELGWLRFAKDDLAPFHEKMKALDSPLLVVPREVQVERSLETVRQAADALCSGRTRLLYRRYFEEWAMAFKLLGFDDKAGWAWIIARHLAGDSPAGVNPAVFQLVMYSLAYHWPDDFKGRAEEAAPVQERRTESGIILP